MRHYFEFGLKGRDIWKNILGLYLFALLFGGGNAWYEFAVLKALPAPAILNWDWFTANSAPLGMSLLFTIAYFLLAFGVIRKTIEALRLRDENFATDYDYGKYVRMILKGTLLSIITLGIYSPWFVVKILRFFTEGVSHRFNYMNFRGRGMTLFGIVVLFIIMPVVVMFSVMPLLGISAASVNPQSMMPLWVFLAVFLWIVIIAIFYCLYFKWLLDFTYGSKRIVLKLSTWNAIWFFVGQTLLTIITCGLYAPAYWLRTWRYFISRTVVGEELVEERLGMAIRPWNDWAYIWGQFLLTCITAGIYLPWAYAKISCRFFPRCYVDEIERPEEPMPEE